MSFDKEKKKLVTETEFNRSVFQLTSSKSALQIEDMKRNLTPTRSFSPFSIKNTPLPQGFMNNKNFIFKPSPIKIKICEKVIKKPFPFHPYEGKK